MIKAAIKDKDPLASAKEQGQAQFDSIKEMVQALQASGEPCSDEAQERILEDALSVQVRSGWFIPGADLDHPERKPAEYEILLCTGGPACRIIGGLDQYGQPDSARLEVQDWFQPWTAMRPVVEKGNYDSEPVLLAYARCFYFGEG